MLNLLSITEHEKKGVSLVLIAASTGQRNGVHALWSVHLCWLYSCWFPGSTCFVSFWHYFLNVISSQEHQCFERCHQHACLLLAVNCSELLYFILYSPLLAPSCFVLVLYGKKINPQIKTFIFVLFFFFLHLPLIWINTFLFFLDLSYVHNLIRNTMFWPHPSEDIAVNCSSSVMLTRCQEFCSIHSVVSQQADRAAAGLSPTAMLSETRLYGHVLRYEAFIGVFYALLSFSTCWVTAA